MQRSVLGPAANIDPSQLLAGVPLLRISAFLRSYRHTSWPADIVEDAFPESGDAILDELIEQGYVVPTSDPSIFKVTMAGEALVNLSATWPVPRSTRA